MPFTRMSKPEPAEALGVPLHAIEGRQPWAVVPAVQYVKGATQGPIAPIQVSQMPSRYSCMPQYEPSPFGSDTQPE